MVKSIADFKGSNSKRDDSKGVVGIMTFTQEPDCTVVTGIFKSGFDGKKPTFEIKDHCGNKLYDLALDVEVTSDGGTKSFKQKFSDLKLDCGPESIFGKDAKTTCGSSYYSKRATGPTVSATPPGTSAALVSY